MDVPLLVDLGAASQLAPLAAAAFVRRRPAGARAWVLAWCALLAATDALSLALGARHTSNLLVINLATPVGGALVLWALSLMQRGDVARLTYRLGIVPFLAVWAVLTWAFDEAQRFSSVADPMAALVALAAAAYTLLSRSVGHDGPLTRADWFWISAGLCLYFGAASALMPLSALLVREAPDLLSRAYEVKSLLEIAAFLAIARGVTCPTAT